MAGSSRRWAHGRGWVNTLETALTVHGEAQLDVVGFAITEFGARLDVPWVVRTIRAEREPGRLISALARGSAFCWVDAHDTPRIWI